MQHHQYCDEDAMSCGKPSSDVVVSGNVK